MFCNSIKEYVNKNSDVITKAVQESNVPKLFRIPVEIMDMQSDPIIKEVLNNLIQDSNIHIELFFATGGGTAVSEKMYENLGIVKKELPKGFIISKSNTVTLMPVLVGEDLTDITLRTRMGRRGITPTNNILLPIGFQNDALGLIRNIILGLKLTDFSKELNEDERLIQNQEFLDRMQREVLEIYKEIVPKEYRHNLNNLTQEDMVNLIASSSINDIVGSLRKLMKLIPVEPVNIEEIRSIYNRVREIIIAA